MNPLVRRRLKRKRRRSETFFYVTLALLIMLFLVAVLAPVLAPNDPYDANIIMQMEGPSEQYPLGTDRLGRCMLSRLLYGAQTSLFASLSVVVIVFVVGTSLGMIAGYFGGVVDTVINRVTTILQAFPRLILAIAVVGALGIGIANTVIAVCMVYWTEYARLSRSLVIGLRSRTFIQAARVCGESHLHIIFRHLLPNIFPSMIVTASLDLGSMIMEISALSYLGLGVESPMAEWGDMMNMGKNYLQTNPWLVIIPGIAIFVTVIIFNLFGEKLRDKLDLH